MSGWCLSRQKTPAVNLAGGCSEALRPHGSLGGLLRGPRCTAGDPEPAEPRPALAMHYVTPHDTTRSNTLDHITFLFATYCGTRDRAPALDHITLSSYITLHHEEEGGATTSPQALHIERGTRGGSCVPVPIPKRTIRPSEFQDVVARIFRCCLDLFEFAWNPYANLPGFASLFKFELQLCLTFMSLLEILATSQHPSNIFKSR